MIFDWDGAGIEAEEGEEIDGKAESYSSKAGKNSKIGKMMWDETPIMVKGKKDKTMKGLKSMKGSKGAIFKSRTESKSSGPSYDSPESMVEPEEESSEGWLSAFDSSSSLSYAELFETTSDVTARNSFANPGHVSSGEFVASGGSTLMTGRVESPEAPTGRKFFSLIHHRYAETSFSDSISFAIFCSFFFQVCSMTTSSMRRSD